MRERNKIILEYGTYMLSFFVSYIASLAKWYYASGIILMVEAVYLYVHWVRESGSLVELRALFTLAWVGGKETDLKLDWLGAADSIVALAVSPEGLPDRILSLYNIHNNRGNPPL